MGYPAETEDDIRKTIRVAQAIPLHRVQYSNFVPLPGTEIFERLVKNGQIDPISADCANLRDNYIGYAPPKLSA